MTRPPTHPLSVMLVAALAAWLVAACASVEPTGGAPAKQAEAPPKVLKGSVLYREKATLPDNAQIKVQLVDATPSPSGAEPVVLAETAFATAGRQVPVPYALRVDGVKAEPGRIYALRASILIDGKVQYITGSRVSVDVDMLPESVSILVRPGTVEPVAADSPAPPGAVKPPAPPRPPPRPSTRPPPPAKK